MTSPKTILITGCAGFIGANFVRQFGGKFPETKIVGLDNFATSRRGVLNESITFYEGSILDENLVRTIFLKHRPEYVFHFAALPAVSYSIEHLRETCEVNMLGTIMLLDAAKDNEVRRFIYSSSSAVYGDAKKLPVKESVSQPNPKSPYAAEKYAGETFCRIYSELFSIDTVCLRYFNVFGPGQYGDSSYATVISAWLESLYYPNEIKAFIAGDGSQTRDFCYVDNIVHANILAMQSEKTFRGEIVNIASGSKATVNQIRKLIEKLAGRKLDLKERPVRTGDIQDSHADISKAKKLLNYRPYVGLEEGLAKTIAWFEERRD